MWIGVYNGNIYLSNEVEIELVAKLPVVGHKINTSTKASIKLEKIEYHDTSKNLNWNRIIFFMSHIFAHLCFALATHANDQNIEQNKMLS